MATASTIITRAQGTLKFENTTIGIPGLEETQLLAVLNAINNEWIESFKKGGGEPPKRIQKDSGGTVVSETDLDGAVAVTDTTISLTSAADASATGGAIIVYDDEMPDFVEYTGKSSNDITGVTNIGFPHEDADAVAFLIKLPSDFENIRTQHDHSGVQVESVNYTYTSGTPRGNQYSLFNSGTVWYLWLSRGATGDFSILYNKNSATIDSTDDSIDIPDTESNNQFFHVYRLCEYIAPLLEKDHIIWQNKANFILRTELVKKKGRKHVKSLRSANQLNAVAGMHGPASFYNPRAGSVGIYQ